jgi:hypothetical protein
MFMIEIIKALFSDGEHTYSTVLTIITIALVIISMYNRIKYLCLKKAVEKVAEAEANTELTGKEKFALVLTWIDKDYPGVFRISLFRTLLEKVVQLAYDNSKLFAKNYIKYKTGYDISEIVENLSDNTSTISIDTNSDISTTTKKL